MFWEWWCRHFPHRDVSVDDETGIYWLCTRCGARSYSLLRKMTDDIT